MNWNWACEQLLNGKRVKNEEVMPYYIFLRLSDNGKVVDSQNGYFDLFADAMSSNSWELYQEPKMWTKKDIRKAKAGIELGLNWIARNITGRVHMYEQLPHKIDTIQAWGRNRGTKYLKCSSDLFLSVKWEDAEPTRLQDIVDSEVNNED